MTTIASDYKPRARADFAERIIDGEAVLVNAQGGEILVLNECGAFLWQQMDGTRDVQELTRLACEEYDVSESLAASDVQAFIASLLARNALAEPPPAR